MVGFGQPQRIRLDRRQPASMTLNLSLSQARQFRREPRKETRRHRGDEGGEVIAALFVETGGAYFGLDGVDPWDEQRDARQYRGPYPVVAHPPCQLWTNLARVNFKRWGGEHNRPGNDGGCFHSALQSVREFGGVLEHPMGSWAWKEYGLLRPFGIGWKGGPTEWVCEVWQSAYGHKARKRTWLFCCGKRPPELCWDRTPGTHQVGHFDKIKPVLSKREASATPPEFRDALILIAQRSNP